MATDFLNEVLAYLRTPHTRQSRISAGFDGYVDEIIQPVATRHNLKEFTPIPSIEQFGQRILNAVGKSTNIELFTHQEKLGGNGPIMANSMASLGCLINYVGALGTPTVHPVFKSLSPNFQYKSISNPGVTRCLEFTDGKIMFGQLALTDITPELLLEHMNAEEQNSFFVQPDLIAMVNWTQTPFMKEIWDYLTMEYLPRQSLATPPYLFVDLADPQKRSNEDILYMLDQLKALNRFYRVILGLNEKESEEISKVLSLPLGERTMDGLKQRSRLLRETTNLHCVAIHPVEFAVASLESQTAGVDGPFEPKPKITTGAGDHFNAGFTYGLVSGLSLSASLLIGVANSGYYVRTAQSASPSNLVEFINDWKK